MIKRTWEISHLDNTSSNKKNSMRNLLEKDHASVSMEADDGGSVPSSQNSEMIVGRFGNDKPMPINMVKKVSDINEVRMNIAEEELVQGKSSRQKKCGNPKVRKCQRLI